MRLDQLPGRPVVIGLSLNLVFSFALAQRNGFAQPHESPSSILSVESVLSEVSQESLMVTSRLLSGAVPLSVAGQVYTIKTRYTPTVGNRIARKFLSDKFASYGLQTRDQQYVVSSGNPGVSYTAISFSRNSRKGWLCTSRGEILVTSDSGTTWTRRRPPEGSALDGLSQIRCLDSSVVYALFDLRGRFLRTTDGGKSWATISAGVTTYLNDFYVRDIDHLWAVGHYGVIVSSSDGGASWEKKLLPGDPILLGIWFVDDFRGTIIAVHQPPFPQRSEGRLYATNDGGVTWTQVPGSWGESLYSIHFLNAELGWIGGSNGRVFRTTNGGSSWIEESLPDTTLVVIEVFFSDSMNGWVTASGGGIYHTSDGGQLWAMQDPRTGAYTVLDIFLFNQNLGIGVGTSETRLRTEDGGQTWVNLTQMQLENVVGTLQGKTYPDQYYLLCAHMDDISGAPWTLAPGADDNASGVAAVLEAARVLRNYEFDYTIKFVTFPDEEVSMRGSTINAQQASWGGQSLLGVINVDMIGYDGNGDRAFTLFSGTDSTSNTLGEKVVDAISRYQIDLFPNTIHNQGPSDALSYWAAGYPTVLLTEDMFSDFNPSYHSTADTWEKLDPVYLTDITKAVVATLADMAGLRGPATQVDVAEELPVKFTLHQNYPNPFNPTTIIRYELPTSGFVSLTIYSILGERVGTLVEQMQKAGSYDAEWNAGDRSSGVYFYRLYVGPVHGEVTDPFIETKKMVLVK